MIPIILQSSSSVALLAESVDRNDTSSMDDLEPSKTSLSLRRAWIEIFPAKAPSEAPTTSLSLRRAWIEMSICTILRCLLVVALLAESVDRNADGVVSGSGDYVVALLAESVDRNYSFGLFGNRFTQSLSLRRAWIEICCPCRVFWLLARRSPCGERG